MAIKRLASTFTVAALTTSLLVLQAMMVVVLPSAWAMDVSTPSSSGPSIPESFDAPFGSYPNLLEISEQDRTEIFHPVIVYPPEIDATKLPVSDSRTAAGLATQKEIQKAKRRAILHKFHKLTGIFRKFQKWPGIRSIVKSKLFSKLFKTKAQKDHQDHFAKRYSLGRYDENRVGMYASEHYDDLDHKIDGYGGRRTVHLGIDLSAPAGTPVRAVADGVVHSVGYNADYGDYGYVIVIEHFWNSTPTKDTRRVWALYGHLDKSTIKLRKKKKSNDEEPEFIQKGQIIGRVGDAHENGGWKAPHVHFQLSMRPPLEPHDMPGASSVQDRTVALMQYIDPRYVLGPLY